MKRFLILVQPEEAGEYLREVTQEQYNTLKGDADPIDGIDLEAREWPPFVSDNLAKTQGINVVEEAFMEIHGEEDGFYRREKEDGHKLQSFYDCGYQRGYQRSVEEFTRGQHDARIGTVEIPAPSMWYEDGVNAA